MGIGWYTSNQVGKKMNFEIKKGLQYKKNWGGKKRLFEVEKIGPVCINYSCWGKYKSQYVWVKCLDEETPFLSMVASYDEIKQAVLQYYKEKK